METIRIAVAGAGVIGRRHVAAIGVAKGACVAAIADPSDAARAFAGESGVPWFPSLTDALDKGGIDAVLLATPNQWHVDGGLACIEAGLPVLVEKPLAADPEGARRLVEAAEARGVPLATGHHRRHNPLIRRAKDIVEAGTLGQIATAQATTWFMKPDDYFLTEWRRKKGAGPVFMNLIHDVDLMMHFCGPIAEVRAMESNAIRGNEVEETAVILLRFASGTLGTVNICNSTVAPLSWEMTSREDPAYPFLDQSCYWLAGTHGSLSLPDLTLWSNPGKRSWMEPINATRAPRASGEPLVLQAEQFARVVRDGEPPLVTGRDGLAALEIIVAVKQAAATGQAVKPGTSE